MTGAASGPSHGGAAPWLERYRDGVTPVLRTKNRVNSCASRKWLNKGEKRAPRKA
jgi:hypothetical protein